MPTDTNLPVMVRLYLELIEKYLNLMNGLDSSTREFQMFSMEINIYTEEIRKQMENMRSHEGVNPAVSP